MRLKLGSSCPYLTQIAGGEKCEYPLTVPALSWPRMLQIYVNIAVATNNAVDPSRCAELNGLTTMAASLGKAFAPFTCAPLFAWSIDRNSFTPFGAHFCFIVLALGMLVVSITGWNSIKSKQDDEEEEAFRVGIVETSPIGNLV